MQTKSFIVLIFAGVLWGITNVQSSQVGNNSKVFMPPKMNQQCFELLKLANQHNPEGNCLISPYNIQLNIAMLQAGAQGKSAIQLSKAFALPKECATIFYEIGKRVNSGNFDKVSTFNSLLVDNCSKVKAEYARTILKSFGGRIYKVDFTQPLKLANKINEIIEKQTMGHMRNVILAENLRFQGDVGIVLFNVMYFKAEWKYPFNQENTSLKNFYLQDGTSTKVNTMTMTERIVYFASWQDNVHGIVLPYRDSRFELIAIMPYRTGNSPEHILEDLAKGRLNDWMSNNFGGETEISLPEIRITERLELKNIMKQMGVRNIFSPSDDFFDIWGGKNFFVASILHVVKFDMNENMTEASTATITVAPALSPPNTVQKKINKFHANRPFIILVREKSTNILLFAGVINNPTGC